MIQKEQLKRKALGGEEITATHGSRSTHPKADNLHAVAILEQLLVQVGYLHDCLTAHADSSSGTNESRFKLDIHG